MAAWGGGADLPAWRGAVRAASCLAALPWRTVEEARSEAEAKLEWQRQAAAEEGTPPFVTRVEERVERLGKEVQRTEAELQEGWVRSLLSVCPAVGWMVFRRHGRLAAVLPDIGAD